MSKKKCRWCDDALTPDDYDRLCERCSSDVIHCSVCRCDQHADDPCRHVFQDQWGQWNGSGAWTPDDNIQESFFGFLDAMPPPFANDLRAAIQSNRFHTWLIAPLIGAGSLLEMRGMPWYQGREYGDAILRLGESDHADDLHDGYRWLVSLYDGKTPKANRLTIRWIDQWRYQRPENESGRWADDGGPHPQHPTPATHTRG